MGSLPVALGRSARETLAQTSLRDQFRLGAPKFSNAKRPALRREVGVLLRRRCCSAGGRRASYPAPITPSSVDRHGPCLRPSSSVRSARADRRLCRVRRRYPARRSGSRSRPAQRGRCGRSGTWQRAPPGWSDGRSWNRRGCGGRPPGPHDVTALRRVFSPGDSVGLNRNVAPAAAVGGVEVIAGHPRAVAAWGP